MYLELILFALVFVSGALSLLDIAVLTPIRRKYGITKMPLYSEYARSFFPVLLLVFSLRSFAYEPFRIPSGSLKPTLLVGDFILVNKYAYGIRLPVLHTKLVSLSEPKRGDIVVFREPGLESRDLIKRVIGLPGDHISYTDKILSINGETIPQSFVKFDTDQNDATASWQVSQKHEDLLGIKHDIYQIPAANDDDFDTVVPDGEYFMMGDNRDDSADSRAWGFLPEKNIIGKATHVIVSFDSLHHPVRWMRTFEKIV